MKTCEICGRRVRKWDVVAVAVEGCMIYQIIGCVKCAKKPAPDIRDAAHKLLPSNGFSSNAAIGVFSESEEREIQDGECF